MTKRVNKYTDKDIIELKNNIENLSGSMNKLFESINKCLKKECFDKHNRLQKHLDIGNYIQYVRDTYDEHGNHITYNGIIIGVSLQDNPCDDTYTVINNHHNIESVSGEYIKQVNLSYTDRFRHETKYGFNLS